MIAIALYHELEGWLAKICDAELSYLYPEMPVKMFIKWPEVISDLGLIASEYLEECSILLENSMFRNVDVDILWLRLLDKYLVNSYTMTRIQAYS